MTLKAGEPPPILDAHMASALARATVLVRPGAFQKEQKTWRETLAQTREHFVADGYVNLSGLMHPLHLHALAAYYREVVCSLTKMGDSQCPLRFGIHNECLSRFVHLQFLKVIELLAGRPVTPSYTYFASYRNNAILERHTDRDQCEITAGLLLNYEPPPLGPSPWPLLIDTPTGVRAIFQAIGDLIVFRGRVLAHRRDALPAHHSSESLLLHYVFREFNGLLQ